MGVWSKRESRVIALRSLSSFVETDLPQLVELAYDAALNEPRWQNFIDAFSDSFDGATGIMYCLDRQRSGEVADAVFSRNQTPRLTAGDAERYLGVNGRARLMPAYDVVGHVALTALADRYAHLPKFLPSHAPPIELPETYLRMPLCLSGRRTVMLALAPDTGLLSEREHTYRRRLELLSPHFVRAVKLSCLAEHARSFEVSHQNLLETFRVCAFVLDAQERIVTMNRLAETFLCSKNVLTRNRFRQLSAILPEHDRLLKAALANFRTSAPERAPAPAPIKLLSVRQGGDYLISLIPLNWGSRMEHMLESSNCLHLFGVEKTAANVLLLACKLEESKEISQDVLMANFGLSRTEARLSATLASGRSLSDYARENGVSRNTARNQLSTVFQKTGVRRQAELVAHIARVTRINTN